MATGRWPEWAVAWPQSAGMKRFAEKGGNAAGVIRGDRWASRSAGTPFGQVMASASPDHVHSISHNKLLSSPEAIILPRHRISIALGSAYEGVKSSRRLLPASSARGAPAPVAAGRASTCRLGSGGRGVLVAPAPRGRKSPSPKAGAWCRGGACNLLRSRGGRRTPEGRGGVKFACQKQA